MTSRQRLTKLLLPAGLVLAAALLLLAMCQGDDPVEEAASTSTAAEEATAPPAAPTAEPETEPTATEAQPETTQEDEAGGDPAPVMALEEYTSVTEFFTAGVPDGWSITEALPGADLLLASSDAAMSGYLEDGYVDSGEFVLNVGFLPYRLMQANELRSLNIQFDAPADVFLRSLLPMFRVADGITLGEPEMVSLADSREAALATITAEGREGVILMVPAGENVIALVSAVAAPGELAQWQELALAVAAELAFAGNHDALYGVLLGG